jgi:hypothetical protein
MIRTTCHCGAVKIAVPRRPRSLTSCDCSICRRYGALWAYYRSPDVAIDAEAGATEEYSWGKKSIAFVRCRTCGCLMHWRPLSAHRGLRMGVNARNFAPEQFGPIGVRLLDGAGSERYVGKIAPGSSGGGR